MTVPPLTKPMNQVLGIVLCLPDSATTDMPAAVPFNDETPSFLLNLIDRPMLQHHIESLAALGVQKIKIFSNVLPEKIRALLGAGERWGCQIEHHLVHDAEKPLAHLATLNLAKNQHVLVTSAHVSHALEQPRDYVMPCVIQQKGQKEGVQTAWIMAKAADLLPISKEFNYKEAPTALKAKQWHIYQRDAHFLSCASGTLMLQSQAAILNKQFPAQRSGYEIEPGVWVSRNVVIHPTVKIIPPIHLSEDCLLDEGVEIGPNVAIHHTCRIGNHTTLAHSAIEAGTCLGEQLSCHQFVVKPGKVWNTESNVGISITDPFLLSALHSKNPLAVTLVRKFIRLTGRLSALLLWVCTLPLHLLYHIKHVYTPLENEVWLEKSYALNQIITHAATHYPAAKARSEAGFRHLLGWLLPGLIHVVSGRWHWVGLPPRCEKEMAEMDEDWKQAYLASKIGLIDEAWIEYQNKAQAFELRLSELYYTSQQGRLRHDARLLLRYPASLLRFNGTRAQEVF